MSATYIYGTGFETGDYPVLTSDVSNTDRVHVTTTKKTGTYGLRLHDATNPWMRFEITGSKTELYIGVWVHPSSVYNDNDRCSIHIYLTDGKTIKLIFNGASGHQWDAYVNGGLVASGTIVMQNQWTNIQLHVKVADAGGRIESRIGGESDINYTGDTEPGTGNVIEYVYLMGGDSFDSVYFDDLVIAEGDWPGDVRHEAIVPNGDNSVQWEPSTGSDNYALVDETPSNDADYVRASGTNHVDKYDLEAWDGEWKHPLYVTIRGQAKKEVADASKLILLLDDGTEGASGEKTLATSFNPVHHIFTAPPSGGIWSEAVINALLVGIKSVIA